MTGNVGLVMGGGLVCLVGFALTGFVLLNEQKRREIWSARRADTIGPYLKPKGSGGPALVLAVRAKQRSTTGNPIYQIFNWKDERRAQYPMSLGAVILCMLGPSAVGGLMATKVIGSAGWFLLPAFDILLVRTFLGWSVGKISRTLLSQFPDALAMVSRSVRVGVPLTEAVRVVGREAQSPTREEFAKAADQVQIGLDLEAALLEMAERNDISEYRFFATALALQSQTGGGLTETLETLADTIRKRENARKRGHALAAEARTSIYVLAALPIVVGAMLFVMNPEYIGMLFTDKTGEKLLGIGIGMLLMGLWTMQQIVKRSLT
ncbi:MAG TPA: type II secretion system F family protein [Acetobacteraceae bacterium]|nr:type II secretion system F family protein [Acetobacteraceae bacterium]